MKINYFLLLPLLYFSTPIFAQKSLSGFDKLTANQLELKTVSFDQDASAVILDESGYLDVNGGGHQLTTRRRIKILNEKAITEGDIQLLFYAHNNIEDIKNVKAQSINLVNGEYVSTPITDKDIFEIDVNKYYKAIRFAIPNVRVGTIIEYQYTLNSKQLYNIDAWQFQHELPTLKSNFKLKINTNADFTNLSVGQQLTDKYKNRKNIDTWELTNIPSYNGLQYVYNRKNVLESIRLQLSGYLADTGYKSTIGKWKDLKKEVKEDYSRLSNNVAVKKYAETIPNGATEKETLDNVVKKFQNDFKWNEFKGIYTNKTQKEILDTRSSNLADLNVLFNSILTNKGIKADLILLSSRSNGKLVTTFPYLDQFDYVINSVKLKDGNSYVINAVDIPKNTFKFAPLSLFNDYGFVLDNGVEENFVTLNQFLSENHVEFKYTVKDGELIEQRKDLFSGYFYDDEVKDSKDLINRYINSPIHVVNDDKGNELKFLQDKYVVNHTAKMGLNSSNFITLENPLAQFINAYTFTETNRKNKIEFNFPYYFKILVTVDIPEGYEVIKSDDFKGVVKTNDNLVYSQNSAVATNKLQILYEFYLGQAVYPATDYEMLKNHFEAVQKEVAKQITLKKK
ncbi:DUF3857 domain-containing protein [Faecalibacter bovis]|uniref:DUF3857 domain-containing protein n=1 Tax=Faecalibacter bovis TaxID=2898187 RepID=A0ABX7XDM9_9FLAO|nr:DUF3857 domain-containing protein [Faecalibacter bovis]QTV05955.1 DUF3857 domain-containing protein [Faecalibacter bovis]